MRIQRIFIATGLVAALGSSSGCEQVSKLDEEPTSGGVPAEVQARFDTFCAVPGCHMAAVGPELTAGSSSAALMMTSSAGPPYVTFGDLDNSQLITRIAPGGGMPPASSPQLSDEDRAVIYGWVAGAPFPNSEGESDTDSGSGSTTGDTMTGSTTDDTASGSESGMVEYDQFVPVLAVMAANCSGVGCHRDGGVTPPSLEDDVAYTNIVNMPNMFAMDMVPYVIPNDWAGSHIVRRITAVEPFTIMPPAPAPALSDADIATITDWIDAGAMP